MNPVKRRYAESPGDWPWPSFHRYVTEGWLDPDWPGARPVELPKIAGEWSRQVVDPALPTKPANWSPTPDNPIHLYDDVDR